VLGVLAMAVAGAAMAFVVKNRGQTPIFHDRGRILEIGPRTAPLLAVGAVALIILGTVAISYSSEQTEDIATSGARLGEVKTYRGPYWKVALNSFSEHPVIGVGSGSYQVEWRRERDTGQFTYNAHSLYFETLAELGLIGGLLLALLYGSVGVGLVRGARAAPRDPVIAAAAAVAAAFAIHVAVDWDWELPAVTLPVLLCVAAALAAPRRADIDSAP
jgi:O-antigen ligase